MGHVCFDINWENPCLHFQNSMVLPQPPPPDVTTQVREVWVEADSPLQLCISLYSTESHAHYWHKSFNQNISISELVTAMESYSVYEVGKNTYTDPGK